MKSLHSLNCTFNAFYPHWQIILICAIIKNDTILFIQSGKGIFMIYGTKKPKNFEKMNYLELIEQRRLLDEQIKQRIEVEKNETLAAINALIEDIKNKGIILSPEEIAKHLGLNLPTGTIDAFEKPSGKANPKGKNPSGESKLKGRTVPVKYKDPDNEENTWKGRGAQPKWLKEHIENGRKIEEFLIAQESESQ